jgi:hypothetical protein
VRSVAVFCGSASGRDGQFAALAADLGRAIAARGWTLVYGGASVGLMGTVADAALEAGGRVVGVIPSMLVNRELAHRGLHDLRVVATMHERKVLMGSLSDMFVALPGGVGTLDELFEMLTWTQLRFHAKPCALLDLDGFYASLVAFLDRAVRDGFVQPACRASLLVGQDPDDLLERCAAWTAGEAPRPDGPPLSLPTSTRD